MGKQTKESQKEKMKIKKDKKTKETKIKLYVAVKLIINQH